MARLAGVELGGTKSIAVLAEGGSIVEQRTFPTAAPAETLAQLNTVLREWHEAGKLAALGIASFGPVRLDPASADYATIRRLATSGSVAHPAIHFPALAVSTRIASKGSSAALPWRPASERREKPWPTAITAGPMSRRTSANWWPASC